MHSDNPQAPSQLDSINLGRWLEFLKGTGNSAVCEKIKRLHETVQKRRDTCFMASCASYGIGLVCFASDPSFLAAIRESSTISELASAMPPEQLEIDCTGRAYQMGRSAIIEIAEIKHSSTSKVWAEGLGQLHLNLKAVCWALTRVQRYLPDKLPSNLKNGTTLLVGHLCVPRHCADVASVMQCVDDWAERGDPKVHVKVMML
jgi:hypothetical protein